MNDAIKFSKREELAKLIEDFWGVNSVGCPFGSCTEDFANNKMIEMAKNNYFPEEIVELIKNNPIRYSTYKHYDNGRGIGRHFSNLVRYFNFNFEGGVED